MISTTVQPIRDVNHARWQIAMYVLLIQKAVSHAIKGSIYRIILSSACRRVLVAVLKFKYMSRMEAILGKLMNKMVVF